MSQRGAPLGNQNAAKAKQWSAAIERALERLADPTIDPDVPIPRSPRAKGLDMMADVYVQRVMAGDFRGFDSIGDRLEGKPAQAHEVSGPDGGPIETKNRLEIGFVGT